MSLIMLLKASFCDDLGINYNNEKIAEENEDKIMEYFITEYKKYII